jgi:hypothetical protein
MNERMLENSIASCAFGVLTHARSGYIVERSHRHHVEL